MLPSSEEPRKSPGERAEEGGSQRKQGQGQQRPARDQGRLPSGAVTRTCVPQSVPKQLSGKFAGMSPKHSPQKCEKEVKEVLILRGQTLARFRMCGFGPFVRAQHDPSPLLPARHKGPVKLPVQVPVTVLKLHLALKHLPRCQCPAGAVHLPRGRCQQNPFLAHWREQLCSIVTASERTELKEAAVRAVRSLHQGHHPTSGVSAEVPDLLDYNQLFQCWVALL